MAKAERNAASKMSTRELLDAMAREAGALAELDGQLIPLREKMQPLQARQRVHQERFDELNRQYSQRFSARLEVL